MTNYLRVIVLLIIRTESMLITQTIIFSLLISKKSLFDYPRPPVISSGAISARGGSTLYIAAGLVCTVYIIMYFH